MFDGPYCIRGTMKLPKGLEVFLSKPGTLARYISPRLGDPIFVASLEFIVHIQFADVLICRGDVLFLRLGCGSYM